MSAGTLDVTLHFILSPETLTHRGGPLSLRARGTAVYPRACSPGRPCLKSVPSIPRVWACCGRHNLSWEILFSEPGQQETGEGLSSEARRKTPILALVLGQATWPPPASFPQSFSQPSTIFPGAQAFQKPGAILDSFPHTHVL